MWNWIQPSGGGITTETGRSQFNPNHLVEGLQLRLEEVNFLGFELINRMNVLENASLSPIYSALSQRLNLQ